MHYVDCYITYSHSSSEKEDELDVQIKHVSSNAELRSQSTKSSKSESVPKERGDINGETYVSLNQILMMFSSSLERLYKSIVDFNTECIPYQEGNIKQETYPM